MFALIGCVLAMIAGLLSIPVFVFLAEVIAALPPPKEKPFEADTNGILQDLEKSAAIIVPAHDESRGILPTIEDIKPQLDKRDRLLVVADNCSDDTAAVAASAGAEVIERRDPQRIGKGYALDWGVRHLSSNPPDFVVFIDADCRIQSDMIRRLKEICRKLQRPVQATFLMTGAKDSPIDHRVAEFAWTVKNWVRPLGLRYLNRPIQLMGTGMIFPWDIIRNVSMATGNIVEDLKLGLDLAAMHKAPQFYPFVIGTSYFPTTAKAAYSQRQRWEHGHIGTILQTAPRMLGTALKQFNVDLFVLILDLIVPPLSLLTILVVGFFFLSVFILLIVPSPAAAIISTANLLALILAVFLAWMKFGRRILPARSIPSIIPYVLSKFGLYGQILSGKGVAKWVRTDRAESE